MFDDMSVRPRHNFVVLTQVYLTTFSVLRMEDISVVDLGLGIFFFFSVISEKVM